MKGTRSVPSDRYVITAEGQRALAELADCECFMEFVDECVLCRQCGTVYSTRAAIRSQMPVEVRHA